MEHAASEIDRPHSNPVATDGDPVSVEIRAAHPRRFRARDTLRVVAGSRAAISLLLASLLQWAPLSRMTVPAVMEKLSGAMVDGRWLVGTIITLGGYHAVSGASGVPAPSVTFTIASLPPGVTKVHTNSINLAGTAKFQKLNPQVWIKKGTNDWMEADGGADWSATYSLDLGTNIFRFQAKVPPRPEMSPIFKRTVVFSALSPLTFSVNGSGSVLGVTNGQWMEVGALTALNALPAPGNLFSNWVVNGASVTPARLPFVMTSNATLTANFVPDPFPALNGSYRGLIAPTSGVVPPDQVGAFVLVVNPRGAFSGSVSLGGLTRGVSGMFDLALNGQQTVNLGTSNRVTVQFQLRAGSGELTGSVSTDSWRSELSGSRMTFNAVTNPAASLAGFYTMVLPSEDGASSAHVGLGVASVRVTRAGVATMVGTLADGSVIARSTPVDADGSLPVYASLYHNKGYLIGSLRILNSATNDVAGAMSWVAPGGLVGSHYPAGLTNEMRVLGSRYPVPAAGLRVLDLTNGVTICEGGSLLSPLTNWVTQPTPDGLTIVSASPSKVSLKLAPPTGFIQGTFLFPDNQSRTSVKCIVLPKFNFAGGFFAGTNESGKVFLGNPEDYPIVIP